MPPRLVLSQLRLSTWHLRPFNEDSEFLVAVLGKWAG